MSHFFFFFFYLLPLPVTLSPFQTETGTHSPLSTRNTNTIAGQPNSLFPAPCCLSVPIELPPPCRAAEVNLSGDFVDPSGKSTFLVKPAG
jgi:hypothetical protein